MGAAKHRSAVRDRWKTVRNPDLVGPTALLMVIAGFVVKRWWLVAAGILLLAAAVALAAWTSRDQT